MRAGYEKANAFGRTSHHDWREGSRTPVSSGSNRRSGADAPNGSAKMAYAQARLRVSDEARSAELAADPRLRTPDPDEETERPCGAKRRL